MSRKREITMMGLGVLTGLALLPAAKAGVATLTATPSTQPIYVDGVRVSMTAYAINGSNYVKLRDIGQAVDFGVTYDAATNSVYIDSDAPYQAEAAKPVQDTASPGTVTEESVKATLDALKVATPWAPPTPHPTTPPAAAPTEAPSATALGGPSCAATRCSATAPGGR